jgi:hypothetical protein
MNYGVTKRTRTIELAHHSMHGSAMQYYGRLRFPMGTCDFWIPPCLPFFILRHAYSPNGNSQLDHNASIDADFLKEVPFGGLDIYKEIFFYSLLVTAKCSVMASHARFNCKASPAEAPLAAPQYRKPLCLQSQRPYD